MADLTAITLDRETAGGRYADILSVLARLKDRYGSSTNAAAHCIRESPSYQEAKSELDSATAPTEARASPNAA